MQPSYNHHPASYRDPSGFIFSRDQVIYRQVNTCYAADFEHLIRSGLYDKLVSKKLLIPHRSIDQNLTGDSRWYTTLQPEPIPLISYPWEWSFDMLKDAALLSLSLAKEAMNNGMMLKDATPFNIQWWQGQLIFIDTLSFEKYNEQEPWIAYRQFCEQFLGPLLLMHYRQLPMQQLSLAWPEGLPLELISALLPRRSRFSLHCYLHIHLNAKISRKNSGKKPGMIHFSRQKMLNLLNSLEILVRKCNLKPAKSTWSGYYAEASGRDNYLNEKKKIIADWVGQINRPLTAADLGANTGEFSWICAGLNIPVLATDADPYCINQLYLAIRDKAEKSIQPLITDLANPAPSLGFNLAERDSFTSRLQAGLCMALALIHHLAIGRNIPLPMIAGYFAQLCNRKLIIEFIPKTDPMLQKLLQGKKDIYPDYSGEGFEKAFLPYFSITDQVQVADSGRVLYLMTRHEK